MSEPAILVTLCARGGSKGVPGKNIRPLLGLPMIAHSIEIARRWPRTTQLIVSTDSDEIARVAESHGARAPFRRPAELSGDQAGKLAVIAHALGEAERIDRTPYSVVVDLDVTSPMRAVEDLERGWRAFSESAPDVCTSAVPARKSPYFNMVERAPDGSVRLAKPPGEFLLSRQSAPAVWELNASIYFFSADFLRRSPRSLWDGKVEIFEMPRDSAFDVDEEHDFAIVEALMRLRRSLE